MFQIFRKVRFQSANYNQLFRYGRYAVGEIVLVVIGILIALYINNWNEERKARVAFDSYIEQLKVDVETAIRNTEETGQFSLLQSDRAQDIIDYLLNPESTVDDESYKEALNFVGRYAVIEVQVGNLGELLSGQLDNVYSDRDLVIKVHDLQGTLAVNLEVAQRMARRLEDYQADLIVFRNEMYYMNYPALGQDWRYDADYLKNSPEFIMIILNLDDANSTYYKFASNTVDELRAFKAYLEENY